MKTTFRIREPYCSQFLKIARETPCVGSVRPTRFMEKMWLNQGSIGAITGLGIGNDGLELRNPVIAALGDSVTAGHFENLLPSDPAELMKLMTVAQNHPRPDPRDRTQPRFPVEITDARESYIEKFRTMLIDKYELSSVSVLNAGIAGDNLIQMAARAERDVIRCQPDLILLNGSLNWEPEMGSTADYHSLLISLVRRFKKETEADIILLTPNGDLPNTMLNPNAPQPTTGERAVVIRQVAEEERVCLCDVYAIWEAARDAGIPWKELLSNGVNHPSVEGHEVYARALMKLFE